MARELFAGRQENKYKILIGKKTISKKNLAPLLKNHAKALVISDDGIPSSITKNVYSICKNFTKISTLTLKQGEKNKSIQNFQKILNFLALNTPPLTKHRV